MMRLLVALLGLLLIGCAADPVERAKTDNPDVRAEILTTVDGCRVYRLYDGNDRRIYFVRCPGSMTQTSWQVTQSTGKSAVTHHYQVDTDSR